jgi:hypothetical protein
MRTGYIDTSTLSREEYWKHFQKLILAADSGTTLTTLGWILFWLDHIPGHVIHTHFITGFVFLAALAFGLVGIRVMFRTRNRLGTGKNRFFHLLKISYTILASGSGIWAYLVFPPH